MEWESSDSSSSEDDLILLCILTEEEEKKKRKKVWVHDIIQKRNTCGEFIHLFPDLCKDPAKFFQYFRMSEEKFLELHAVLAPEIVKANTKFRRAISTEQRLAVCLRFLATGDTFRTIGFSFRLGDTTVRNIVYEVCHAIWKLLRPKVMPEPTQEMWKSIEKDFSEQWNFPNSIGALDGKHVVLDKPGNSGSLYINYKKSFSIILLGLVDANYKFIAVDVGSYGRNSDGGVFSNSLLGKKLVRNELHIPEDKYLTGTTIVAPHVFVGDEAFPLQNHLMRPYPGLQIAGNIEKKVYNYRLSRARRVSENCFGIMTKKIRFLQRKLQISPEHMDIVVLATCTLHNFLRHDSSTFLPEPSTSDTLELGGLEPLERRGGLSTTTANQVIDTFKDYFVSPAGSTGWQNDMVNRGRLN